jgi:formylglycine-generating enzyme required for sulfatase activity
MGGGQGINDENPVHDVKIPTRFFMSQYEITFEEYDYFIWQMHQANIKQVIDSEQTEYLYPFDESWGRDIQPVMNISWWDAQAYANWLSKQKNQICRLPSEAEWEYAARAGTITNYPWGDEIGSNRAHCDGCGSKWDNKQATEVGQFTPNAFRLYDMHGNVFEWVQDLWHDNYLNAPENGNAWEVEGDANRRVFRGGSWGNPSSNLHSTTRFYKEPDTRASVIGFRIVCSSH